MIHFCMISFFLACLSLTAATPMDLTNAQRIQRGLPLKAPVRKFSTPTRRDNPGVSAAGVKTLIQVISNQGGTGGRKRGPSVDPSAPLPQPSYLAYIPGSTGLTVTTEQGGATVFTVSTSGNSASSSSQVTFQAPDGSTKYLSPQQFGSTNLLATSTQSDGGAPATANGGQTSVWSWTSFASGAGVLQATFVNYPSTTVPIYFALPPTGSNTIPTVQWSSTPYSGTSQNPISLSIVAYPGPVDENARILQAHNEYRAEFGNGQLPALTWSTDLQTFAANRAALCNYQHAPSTGTGARPGGENLFEAYGTYVGGYSAVNAWGPGEYSLYDYTNPQFQSAAGHFTQVIWKGTTQVGCAFQQCAAGTPAAGSGSSIGPNPQPWTYIVCEYLPSGNVQGQFAANVLKPNGS